MVRTVLTPREQLATTLRQARIDAGYDTHGTFAAKLHVSRPLVSRAENPAQPVPSDGLLAAWAGATGVALDKLTGLAGRAKSGTPEWFMSYRQAEAEATLLRCWAPLVIPGLLQCEAYARAILGAKPYTPERLTELVAARMERQQVIGHAYLTAIIDTSVFGRRIGGPEVMAEQCAHLATAAERPQIALHVVPDGVNHGIWGAFDIASSAGLATVCLTTALEDVTTNAPERADNALQAFERILGSALPREASLDFAREQEQIWKTQI